MRGYARLLARRDVVSVLLAQLLARSPYAMLPLSLLTLAEHRFGSFEQAALVVAATSTGQAVSTLLTAKLLDLAGVRTGLLLATGTSTGALVAAVAIDGGPLTLLVLAGVSGAASPPVQAVARAVYPSLVPRAQMPRLAHLDASGQEIIWLIGPVVLAGALAIAPIAGVALTAVMLLTGGLWFAFLPAVGQQQTRPASTRSLLSVLRLPATRRVGALGLILGASCAAIETAIAAQYGGTAAGLLLAAWAAASLTGGVAAGAWRHEGRRALVLAAIFACGAAFWAACSGSAAFAVGLALSGIAIAPLVAAMFESLRVSVGAEALLSANAWIITAQLVGYAIGAGVAGPVIDGAGAAAGYVAGAVLAVGVVLAGAVVPEGEEETDLDITGSQTAVCDPRPQAP